MRRFLPILAVLSLTVLSVAGCAFYEKNYVSRIVLEGQNYRPKLNEDGVLRIRLSPEKVRVYDVQFK